MDFARAERDALYAKPASSRSLDFGFRTDHREGPRARGIEAHAGFDRCAEQALAAGLTI